MLEPSGEKKGMSERQCSRQIEKGERRRSGTHAKVRGIEVRQLDGEG